MCWWLGCWRQGGLKDTRKRHCRDAPNQQEGLGGKTLTTAPPFLIYLTTELLTALVVRWCENLCREPPNHQAGTEGPP